MTTLKSTLRLTIFLLGAALLTACKPSPTPPDGAVLLEFASGFPAGTTTVRIIGYDATNTLVFGPDSEMAEAEVSLPSVPLGATTLEITAFAGDNAAGLTSVAVTVSSAEISTVTVPPFNNIQSALLSIAITPDAPTLEGGETLQLSATGTFADGSHADLSTLVNWLSDTPTTATVSTTGGVTALSPGIASISATYLSQSATVKITVTAPGVVGLNLNHQVLEIPLGTQGQLSANAIYSDGSILSNVSGASWTSGDVTIATVDDSGKVSAVSAGETTVSATYQGTSASAAIAITDATLLTLTIVQGPSLTFDLGESEQLTAMGTFSDGSTIDVSTSADWASSSADVTVTRGLISAAGIGGATVTASLGGQQASVTITVAAAAIISLQITPAITVVALGENAQLLAQVEYSDGTVKAVTDTATWTVSAAHASVSDGMITTASVGSELATATYAGWSTNATIEVIAPVLVGLTVSPTTATVGYLLTKQLTATAHYSDGSTLEISDNVIWWSDTPLVAGVSASGLVTAAASSGTANISAGYGGFTASCKVTDAISLQSIALSASATTLATGNTELVTLTGTFSDGSTATLDNSTASWSSDNVTAAKVIAGGLVSAVGDGSADIIASIGSLTTQLSITVTAPAVSLRLSPRQTLRLAPNQTQQLELALVYSDGSETDITNSENVTWSGPASAVATLSSSEMVTAVAAGQVTISASYSGMTSSITVLVHTLTSIAVVDPDGQAQLARGTQLALQAIGTWSDGIETDLTQAATWSSNASGTIGIVGSGLVSGAAAGTTLVNASYGGVSGSRSLLVNQLPLQSLAIWPPAVQGPPGSARALRVYGTFGDETSSFKEDLTSDSGLAWTSGDSTIAFSSGANAIIASHAAAGAHTTLAVSHSLSAVISAATTVTASSGDFLYAAPGSADVVPQFSLGDDGLTALTPAGASSPSTSAALAVSPGGTALYTANNSGSALSQFSIGSDGTLSPLSPATSAATGTLHAIAVGPTSQFVYAINNGAQTLLDFNADLTGALTLNGSHPLASSPQRVVVHPNGRFVYAAVWGGNISQFSANLLSGGLTPLNPATVSMPGHTQPFTIHPSGQYAYGGAATGEPLYQFYLNPDGTLFTPPQATVTTSANSGMRAVIVSPNGRYAYVVSASNLIDQLRIDEDGTLEEEGPEVITSPTAGNYAASVLFDRDGTHAWFSDAADGEIYSLGIDGNGKLIPWELTSYPVSGEPQWIDRTPF